jgi:hypothetical protein
MAGHPSLRSVWLDLPVLRQVGIALRLWACPRVYCRRGRAVNFAALEHGRRHNSVLDTPNPASAPDTQAKSRGISRSSSGEMIALC